MTKEMRNCPVCGNNVAISRFDKELQPCPFCGSEYVGLFTVPSECGVRFIAGCEECGARTRECIGYTDAIELWNERHTNSAKTQDMPLVRKVIFEDWSEAYASMERNALAMLDAADEARRIGEPDEDERDVLDRISRRCRAVIDALNIR
ncbi:MAG: Lar family restriction alleviation protein [Synergistaceae bacterium]|nr:Lar family restriction alleviation protein [Synergistaceae bacterium]